MTADIIQWILGVAIMVLFGVIGFLINWNRGQDLRMGEIEKEASRQARHTAENYVRGHEIAEVKKAVGDLRVEMAGQVKELAAEVSALTKAVYEMMGHTRAG